MAIHKFVRAVSRGEPLAYFGDGSTRRDYTFVDDIVAGVVASCERAAPGAYRLYNLGGTRTTSLAELVAIVERVVGKPAILDRQPPQPGDVPVTYADITHASRDLGYAPSTTVEDGVRAFWDWYRVHVS
jgi:UDP-glucuronate 4-epimerase